MIGQDNVKPQPMHVNTCRQSKVSGDFLFLVRCSLLHQTLHHPITPCMCAAEVSFSYSCDRPSWAELHTVTIDVQTPFPFRTV